jgi:predicted ATPase
LYGNNGSGKSTVLNLIANKLQIKGGETVGNQGYNKYALDYMTDCSFSLGEEILDGESGIIPYKKYSNGETSMQLFEEHLIPNALYLLDEPETSLSPANQIQLAEQINHLARFFDCQFIIATHSPFMLGTLSAKIYNLDAPQLQTCSWHELDNVRFFYDFFQKHNHVFE